jgi:hypothetical protein
MRQVLSGRGREWLIGLVGVVWLIAFYAWCHPYRGVRHDAVLYFGQAQLHLTPAWMSQDVFFQGGSQDRYSIFSRLFAPLLGAFGLGATEMGAMLVLHALFWLAACLLVREVPAPLRWGMVAVAMVMPHFYGALRVFSFTEPFLTARSLSEFICLLALVAMQRERFLWAGVALLLAAAAHPLVALPVWAICWFLMWERDRRWAWAGLAVVAAAVAGLFGVAPLAGLFKAYDPEWFSVVVSSNSFDLFKTWDTSDVAQGGFDLVVLGIASAIPGMPLRRLCRASLLTCAVLCVASAITVDWLHLILPTQLQLWRALWIAHLLALLVLLPCILSFWSRGSTGQLAAAMLPLAAVIVGAQAKTSFLFALASALVSLLALRGAHIKRGIAVFGIGSCILGAVLMGAIEALQWLMLVLQHVQTGLAFNRVASIPASISEFMLLVVWLAIMAPTRAWPRIALPISAAVGIFAIVTGASQWDQRDGWARRIEGGYASPHPFQADIPPSAQVFWPDELLATWAMLKRPSYESNAQASGALFVRAPIMEFMRRLNLVEPLYIQSRECIAIAQAGMANYGVDQCKYTEVVVKKVCRSKGAPDFIVLSNRVITEPKATWVYRDNEVVKDFYLYDCSRF